MNRSLKHIPQGPLRQFVDCLWYWEGAPKSHAKERLMPNGEFSIIFNLREEAIRIYDVDDLHRFKTYGVATVSGARSRYFVIDTDQQERVVGIQFRPGGAAPFLGMPASEAANDSLDLNDVWPGKAVEIRERLLEAPTPEEALCRLERFLLNQLRHAPALHPTVAYALDQFQKLDYGVRIAEVSAQAGLSSRRFIELFRRQVGLTPKVFCRVRRFQRVLEAIHARRDIDWADVAIDCGYFDQAHFIHDFQQFSGLTPVSYVAAATANLNHVILL